MSAGQLAIKPHLVRYGTAADQQFLLGDFLEGYDQLVINATMIAHMPGALASFVTQRAKNKPYFIDPQTHAFQHDIGHLESAAKNNSRVIKRSIRSLLEAYGEPVKSLVGRKHQSVLPGDFKSEKVRIAFCQRVVNFQLSALAKEVGESDSAKYYQFLRKKGQGLGDSLGPSLVVAPYFYMTSNTVDAWLPVNLQFIRHGQKVASEKKVPLAAQVVVSRDVFVDRDLRSAVVNGYSQTKPDYFLVWVDSFSETQASRDQLGAFVDFLQGLGKVAPVVNLYGGYLSVVLMRSKKVRRLVGVTHGLEYGEDRGVVPVGGGIPVSKFYLPVLHSRIPFREAVRAVRELGGFNGVKEFHTHVCDCRECKTVIKKDPEQEFAEYGRTRPVTFIRRSQPVSMEYPLPETKARCVKHYMWCKAREYAAPFSLEAVIAELERGGRLGRVRGLERVAHCSNWKSLLTAGGSDKR